MIIAANVIKNILITKNGTRMTRICRILVQKKSLNPRHPRSISREANS
jgi:hypothetical protein